MIAINNLSPYPIYFVINSRRGTQESDFLLGSCSFLLFLNFNTSETASKNVFTFLCSFILLKFCGLSLQYLSLTNRKFILFDFPFDTQQNENSWNTLRGIKKQELFEKVSCGVLFLKLKCFYTLISKRLFLHFYLVAFPCQCRETKQFDFNILIST